MTQAIQAIILTGGYYSQFRPRHKQQSRDLKYYVSHIVADVKVVKLIAIEAEVLLKTANVCIANVCLVFRVASGESE